jgi:hypothetical protein
MLERGIIFDPEELDRISAAFADAWLALQPGEAAIRGRDLIHQEWLAKLVLSLRAKGHDNDLATVATRQFLATAPTIS